MSLPGLFVEYLVSGSVAMIWLLPLLFTLLPNASQNENLYLVFIPGLYVLGMAVDYLSWRLTRRYKKRLQQKINQEYGVKEEQMKGLAEKLLILEPELLSRLDMYSSRDRIARGTALNSAIATLLSCGYFFINNQIISALIALFCGLVILFLCLSMWKQYQYSSYRHEAYSLRVLNDKKNVNKNKLG